MSIILVTSSLIAIATHQQSPVEDFSSMKTQLSCPRDTQRERETLRHRERETLRHRERERDTETHRERERERH